MQIVKLTAENVKRLYAVEITPEGHIVEIRGKNMQGKSSIIDAIAMALGGGRLCPDEPIHRGQDHAEVVVDLGDLTVKRTWTEKDTYLTVSTRDGAEYKAPQKILDKLVGNLTFDPLAFKNLKKEEKLKELIILLGIGDKLKEVDAKISAAADARKNAKRDVERVQGEIAVLAVPDDTPDEPVDVGALTKELEGVFETRGKNRDLVAVLDRMKEERDSLVGAGIPTADQQIRELKTKLEAAQAKRQLLLDRRSELEKQIAEVVLPVDPDPAPIQEKISKAQSTNALVAKKTQKKELSTKLIGYCEKEAEADTQLEKLREERLSVLRGAEYPVVGLGFNETGVTFNDLPFEQASSAEQLRVSVSIAMKANPKLKVLLVRGGNDLDQEQRKVLYDMIQEDGYQLWIERVDDEAKTGLVIEDGRIRGQVLPEKKAEKKPGKKTEKTEKAE